MSEERQRETPSEEASATRAQGGSGGWLIKLITSHKVIGLALVGLLVAHTARYFPFIADDALISLRYSARLLSGEGLTWTAGEAVEGYSNLSWTLGAAALGALGVDLITALRALGFIAVGLALWALSGLAMRGGSSRAQASLGFACGGLVLVSAPPVAVWTIGGLEAVGQASALALYLVGSAALLSPSLSPSINTSPPHRGWLERSAPYWGAMLCLTRPDGPLFVALWALCFAVAQLITSAQQASDTSPEQASDTSLDGLWSRLKPGLPFVMIPALATLAQLGFRVAYYGDWVPNTAHLKATISSDTLQWGLEYWDGAARVLWPLLIPALWSWRSAQRGVVVTLWMMIIAWITYIGVVGGDFFPGHRHAVVVMGLLSLLIALGGSSLRVLWSRAAFGLACVIASGSTYQLSEISIDYRRAELERWEWDGEIIGGWIGAAWRDRDPLLAVTAAGTLPYFSGLRALDMQGLNDRHIALQPPRPKFLLGHNHGDGAYVLSRKPDLLAFRGVGLGEPKFVSGHDLKRSSEFSIRYRLRTLEGQYPYWVKSKLYMRLDGALGVQYVSEDERWIPAHLFLGGVAVPGAPHEAQAKRDVAIPPSQIEPASEVIGRWPIGQLIRLTNFPTPPGRWYVETDPPLPIRISPIGQSHTGRSASLAFQIAPTTDALAREAASTFKRTHEVLVRGVKLKRIAGSTPEPSSTSHKSKQGVLKSSRFVVSTESLESLKATEREQTLKQTQQGLKPRILDDFERVTSGEDARIKWRLRGRALRSASEGSRARQNEVTGYGGERLLNSFSARHLDRQTGSRWSGPIKLGDHRILSFKLGGGKLTRRVGLRLWVNGVTISSWGGEDSERLKQHHVDLSAYRGATIELELFDEASGMWGHILADDFVLYPDWESALRGE